METKNIKIKQITSVVHKTKGRLKTPAYVTNKKKENLLIHLGSIIKKKIHMNMKEYMQLTSNMLLLLLPNYTTCIERKGIFSSSRNFTRIPS
jgi:hypothetical protein